MAHLQNPVFLITTFVFLIFAYFFMYPDLLRYVYYMTKSVFLSLLI